MNRIPLPLVLILALSITLFTTACKDDKASEGPIVLNINYAVGAEDLVFDVSQYQTAQNYEYSIITMRHYLSRIKIMNENGDEVLLKDVHYADARIPETSQVDLGKVPNAVYNEFEFIFGLDEEMNVDGGLDNTIENINMEWPIPGDQGYHYMKYEGKYLAEPGGETKSFNLHTGATGGNQNYIRVRLPIDPVVVDGDAWTIDLTIDLAEWLENPQTYDFEEFGSAIMMNQQAQEVLKANGATVFALHSFKD